MIRHKIPMRNGGTTDVLADSEKRIIDGKDGTHYFRCDSGLGAFRVTVVDPEGFYLRDYTTQSDDPQYGPMVTLEDIKLLVEKCEQAGMNDNQTIIWDAHVAEIIAESTWECIINDKLEKQS